ncbi:peptidase domain-containing ABC transporter [Pseudoalteromonas piratica]|uniref:ABC transporter ATP-binding protein n=1 Tax=Pseudoalteromonas piratica TaxID=1348114 RepID=A0A0A7EI80_9GAMM|nr:peptidase domain-containing ABC transporter [Pseudoalteromonas piratica]AIY66248.1 ABC transporter ATP-binding protein [Pseudoalteromonas piratica]
MENNVSLLSLVNFNSSNKLPQIIQSELSECGIACIVMISSFFGKKVDINYLRKRFETSLKGSTLHQLISISDELELSSRALRLELHELTNLKQPSILHWDLNHFVVLKKATKNYIEIHDPAIGLRRLSYNEVSKHFTGVALELTPTSEFKKEDVRQKVKIQDLWNKMIGLIPALLRILFLSLILQFVALASPYYLQLVLDEVVLSHDYNLLIVLALGFALLTIINILTTAFRSLVTLHLSSILSIQLASNLFRHLLRLPLSFFEKRHTGDIVSRFESLDSINKIITTGLVEILVDALMALSTLILIYIYSPQLSLVVISAVLLYALLRLVLFSPMKRLTEDSIVTAAKENTNFMETVRSVQSIKLFNGESKREIKWQNCYADNINATIKLGKLNILFTTLNNSIFGFEKIIIIFLAAKAVMAGGLTIGMMMAFMSYKQQFSSRMIALIEKLLEIKMLNLHLGRIADIALTDKENTGKRIQNKRLIKGNLMIDNIGYRYTSDEPYIFENLSLKIDAGSSIAITGPSGVGKSTLLKLLMGIFRVQRGNLLIDGQEINHLGIENYRSQIAAVMQDDQLISGSIRENISFFDTHIKFDKVEECAKNAGVYEDIIKMPMGFDSLIGEMGSVLSGGQKQRILLARALYKEPKILFLDEATSHLDISLEKMINDKIKSLNITRIMVAHRPETISSADKVYTLSNGKLIEVKK